MAKVETVEIVKSYQVTLTAEEAGYLLDLLSAHVGGGLTYDSEPLGSIRAALVEGSVDRLLATNRSEFGRYAVLYR